MAVEFVILAVSGVELTSVKRVFWGGPLVVGE